MVVVVGVAAAACLLCLLLVAVEVLLFLAVRLLRLVEADEAAAVVLGERVVVLGRLTAQLLGQMLRVELAQLAHDRGDAPLHRDALATDHVLEALHVLDGVG